MLIAVFLRLWQLNVLPVGFHHDDALDGLSAADVLTGTHPIFFNNYNPREPLMIYFQSIGVLLFGRTRLGASSMPALFGVAEVVLAWFLARDLFGRRVALLTAGFTAVSFWHVFVSRLSERAISQPLVEGLCLLFFWRTLARRRWLDAGLAGAFLGLSLYTYSAARALPILLLLLVLWQLITVPHFWRKSLGQMLSVAAIGVVVFLPLGVHFLQYPQDFYGRSLEVNVIAPQPFTGSAQAGGVRTAVFNTLGMFSIRGDGTWKYNLSGQPVFDWPMSALFYGGLLVAIAGLVQYLRQRRSQRAIVSPYVFVLLWLPAMLIPGFISSESPHFLRTVGIIPAVFMLPALAAAWLVQRWRFVVPLAVLLVGAEGIETYQHYFRDWAHAAQAYYANHGDVADAAAYLKTAPNLPILFSTEYPNHPTILFLAPRVFPRIRWFNGQQSLVFPSAGQPTLYVFPANYQPRWAQLSQYFRPDQLIHEGHDPSGAVSYRVYESDSPPPEARPLQPLSADLGGLANLQGVALPTTIQAGQAMPVLEYWAPVKTAPPGLRAFVHLVDQRGHQWAQADNLGFYSEDWRPGDVAINEQDISVPATAPPIAMKVQFGLYVARTGERLSLADAQGRPIGTELTLGTVHVKPAPSPATPERLPHSMSETVAPGLTLLGFRLGATSVQAGGKLPVTLYWRVDGSVSSIPNISLQGIHATDVGLTSELAAADWPLGVVLEDRHDLAIDPTTHAGEAVVRLGGLDLGQVTITEPQRAFDLSPLSHPLNLPVGDFASLASYDVSPLKPGGTLQVALIWQARAMTRTSYKVFVHVLDAGNHVIAQRDDFPQSGAMPTTLWVPGQTIMDRYDVPLPASLPANVQLEVGMYEPVSGKRVIIGGADHVLLPLTVP